MHSYNLATNLLPFSQAYLTIEIECLVKDLEPKFSNSHLDPARRVVLEEKCCEVILRSFSGFISVYSSKHDYSEHVKVFFQGCKALGLLAENSSDSLGSDKQVMPTKEQAYELIAWITEAVKQPQFKRGIYDRRYEMKSKNASLVKYAQALHAHHARLLFVRVDFYYRMESQHLIGIDDVYQHLDTFIGMKTSHKEIFEHEVGNVWSIEQGETRGYHIHLASYFLGSKHQCDWFKAKQIGELWEELTGGLGTYHSCNTPSVKSVHERKGTLGVGMILRNDTRACDNAISAVSYLAKTSKENQYLRMKPKGRRTFATGVLVFDKIKSTRLANLL